MASADLTDPQSLNMYTYARNNPIDLVDPSGTHPRYTKYFLDGIEISEEMGLQMLGSEAVEPSGGYSGPLGFWVDFNDWSKTDEYGFPGTGTRFIVNRSYVSRSLKNARSRPIKDLWTGFYSEREASLINVSALFHKETKKKKSRKLGIPLRDKKKEAEERWREEKRRADEKLCNSSSLDISVSLFAGIGGQVGMQINPGKVRFYYGFGIGFGLGSIGVSVSTLEGAPSEHPFTSVQGGFVGGFSATKVVEPYSLKGEKSFRGAVMTPGLSATINSSGTVYNHGLSGLNCKD